MMQRLALGRAETAKAERPILLLSARQRRCRGRALSEREGRLAAWQIVGNPMHDARPIETVDVEDDHGETLRCGRCVRPRKRRRLILTSARRSIDPDSIEQKRRGQNVTVLERGRTDLEYAVSERRRSKRQEGDGEEGRERGF